MRKQHWLKHNARNELPSHMVFVDTESNIETDASGVQTHTLKMGVACATRIRRTNGRETVTDDWFTFHTPEQFWSWLTTHIHDGWKVYVFAHNWNYDAGILATATIPYREGWIPERYVNEKPPFILSFRKDKSTMILVDTLNFFQGTLATIGDNIGISKLDMPDDDAGDDAWFAYCKRDVEVIRAAMLEFRSFVEHHNLGNFQSTLPSQAFSAFTHRFLPERVFIHNDERALRLERSAYYGGRTECFYLGSFGGGLHYLDVNSMYPWVMVNYPVPLVYKDCFGAISVDQLEALLDRFAVVATVLLETTEPAFPYRYGQRLLFPVGRFTTTLSTPELQYALDRGYILAVVEGAKYTEGVLFKDFVEFFYSLRRGYIEDGNKTWQYLCKIMLNSLYGKFGQNGRNWETVGEWNGEMLEEWAEVDPDTNDIVRYRTRLGLVQRFSREGESNNSSPAVAAHITAYARMYLWSLIQQAGEGNVLYVDTDSLIVTEEGYQRLQATLDPKRLGALKEEASAETAVIWGVKDYRFGDVEKHKGIRRNAKQLSPNEWLQDMFISWDVLMSRGIDGSITVKPQRKKLSRVYHKGNPINSGLVEPYFVVG